MIDKHLELVCGDPEKIFKYEKKEEEGKKIAVKNSVSFTRFIFPFAYKKEKAKENIASDLYYEEYQHSSKLDKKIFLQRLKYFTLESRECMFQRAGWFQIPKEKWEQTPWGSKEGVVFQNTLNGCKFKIRMSPPILVLFEWEDNSSTESEKRKNNFHKILKTGFLICEIWFPDGSYLEKDDKNDDKKNGCKNNKIILDDLLYFNDLFRCFDYPLYTSHWDQYKQAMANIPTDYHQKELTVEKLLEPPKDKEAEDEKDKDEAEKRIRAYFDRWCKLLTIPIKEDKQYYQIVTSEQYKEALNYLLNPKPDKQIKNPLLIYEDYRTFVWSAAVLKEGGRSIAKAFRTSQQDPIEFGHWIKFLNVDPPDSSGPSASASVSEFEKKWAKDRTYYRWVHFSTWYGFNYHAGVAIMAEKIGEQKSPYLSYFRHIYFDMILLLFYMRVTLFRFSNALTQIAQKASGWRKQFVYLRRAFNKFTILYQFPLFSNQQQAIEMYEIARKHFDIKEFYEETKREIDDTHEYLETKKANELSELGNTIAQWGIPLAVAGVVASLFGMDLKHLHVWEYLTTGLGFRADPEFWILFAIVFLISIASWIVIRLWLKKLKNK